MKYIKKENKHCKVCSLQIGKSSRSLLCGKHRLKKWIEENRARSNDIKNKYVKSNPFERYLTLKKYRENNRKRVNAWAVLQYHVNKGKIIKNNICEVCKVSFSVHAHHPNINKPLDVVWVCASCHKKAHGLNGGLNYAT